MKLASGNSRKTWILLAIVSAAGFYGCGKSSDSAPKYETVNVDRGKVTAKVTASGTLSAIVTVQVGSQVSGRIQKLYVDFNSKVKKGDMIAKIDPSLFDAAVAQNRANYVAAKANLDKSKVQAANLKLQYERSKSLAKQSLVAQADLDTAKAAMDAADADVASSVAAVSQTAAALHQSEVNLQYTDIRSPIDGFVISRSVDVGQTVAASLQAPVLFVIAEDLRKMQVDTWIAEADVGKLKEGMKAFFTVDAYPGERFNGTVRQIRNSPQTQQNVVTYDAVIDVDNAELKLKPGMTANATFVYAEKQDVLRIPNAALRFRPSRENKEGDAAAQQGHGEPAGPEAKEHKPGIPSERKVWVLRTDKPEPVTVKTGVTDGVFTELVEGEVKEGDALITESTGGSGKPSGGGGSPGPMRRIF